MIETYYRPDSIEEAVDLLKNPELSAIPLGGGIVVSKMEARDLNVVDLQNLPLTYIHLEENKFHMGAAVKLEELRNAQELPDALKIAIEHECSFNLRQQASLAGSLLTSDGRSPLACVFLALNAKLVWLPSNTIESLEEYFGSGCKTGVLISEIVFEQPVLIDYDFVARTPFDQPIIQASRVQWASGRTRLVVGGWGKAPRVAFDSQKGGSQEAGLHLALSQADDDWATKEYRLAAVEHLINRFPVVAA